MAALGYGRFKRRSLIASKWACCKSIDNGNSCHPIYRTPSSTGIAAPFGLSRRTSQRVVHESRHSFSCNISLHAKMGRSICTGLTELALQTHAPAAALCIPNTLPSLHLPSGLLPEFLHLRSPHHLFIHFSNPYRAYPQGQALRFLGASHRKRRLLRASLQIEPWLHQSRCAADHRLQLC